LRVLELGVGDRWMSTRHARLSKVMRAWILEDLKSKNGVRVNGEPISRIELKDGDVIEAGRSFFVFRAAQPLLPGVAADLAGPLPARAPAFATLDSALAVRFEQLARIAESQVTVALFGASGSGKE